MQIVELYTEEDIARMKNKILRWTVGLGIFGGLALAACIIMAAVSTTATAEKLEIASILVSAAAGWVVIYDALFVVIAGKRELSHAQMLHTEERIRREGSPVVTDKRLKIRKSIIAKRVRLPGSDDRILVCESVAKKLSKANATAIYTAHGYVAAYEVAP